MKVVHLEDFNGLRLTCNMTETVSEGVRGMSGASLPLLIQSNIGMTGITMERFAPSVAINIVVLRRDPYESHLYHCVGHGTLRGGDCFVDHSFDAVLELPISSSFAFDSPYIVVRKGSKNRR